MSCFFTVRIIGYYSSTRAVNAAATFLSPKRFLNVSDRFATLVIAISGKISFVVFREGVLRDQRLFFYRFLVINEFKNKYFI